MTIELFMFFLAIGSTISSLLTEAFKKAFPNLANNILAMAAAFVVGIGGTMAAYIIFDIAFTPKNILCIILMFVCVFIGSMVGYDKVLQTIEQIKRG